MTHTQPLHPSGSTIFASGRRIAVLLPLPLAGAYDYRVGEGMELAPGDFVIVPLGRRQVIGVVWGPGEGQCQEARVKAVLRRLPALPLPEPSRKLIDWVAAYTLSAPGAVLKMAMSVPQALEAEPMATVLRRAAQAEAKIGRLTPARRSVLDLAAAGPLGAADLAREAGVGASVLKALVQAGALEEVIVARPALFAPPDTARPRPVLSPGQKAAAQTLVDAVGRGFSVTLMEGVTGSGKTEVYFEALAAALDGGGGEDEGGQVLVLLPEIALSAQWLDRFTRRFGVKPAQWHSDLTPAQRRETWREVSKGTARVVVGARSALFLPFPKLALIVVDEEHDPSFKQDEGVVYHGRDMAVVRGRVGGIPVVLASATPSLESVVNAQAGRYGFVHLPDRHGAAQLPAIAAIDMRRSPPERGHWLSPILAKALAETFAAGEQAMLFLNRRGYAPLTLCRACGHRLQCPNCTAWLVEHRKAERLQCHHCGYVVKLPEKCPSCEVEANFTACGPGVERVAEEVAQTFPQARMAVMASDTLSSPAQAAELVRKMAERELDILVGTQVMAKGHHFPLLTLVGVVDADLGLAGGDLRASERTYQLLSQVAGRAGRAEHPGRVLLQTFDPENPVLQALIQGDKDGFIAAEIAARQAVAMPPFGRLAALIVSSPDSDEADRAAAALARAAPRLDTVDVLGPAPAPMAILRGRHRRRLLLKASRSINIQTILKSWLAPLNFPKNVRVQVDIDPYSFL